MLFYGIKRVFCLAKQTWGECDGSLDYKELRALLSVKSWVLDVKSSLLYLKNLKKRFLKPKFCKNKLCRVRMVNWSFLVTPFLLPNIQRSQRQMFQISILYRVLGFSSEMFHIQSLLSWFRRLIMKPLFRGLPGTACWVEAQGAT